jgi:hypothetical protein
MAEITASVPKIYQLFIEGANPGIWLHRWSWSNAPGRACMRARDWRVDLHAWQRDWRSSNLTPPSGSERRSDLAWKAETRSVKTDEGRPFWRWWQLQSSQQVENPNMAKGDTLSRPASSVCKYLYRMIWCQYTSGDEFLTKYTRHLAKDHFYLTKALLSATLDKEISVKKSRQMSRCRVLSVGHSTKSLSSVVQVLDKENVLWWQSLCRVLEPWHSTKPPPLSSASTMALGKARF